jgi:hypothetical protein
MRHEANGITFQSVETVARCANKGLTQRSSTISGGHRASTSLISRGAGIGNLAPGIEAEGRDAVGGSVHESPARGRARAGARPSRYERANNPLYLLTIGPLPFGNW